MLPEFVTSDRFAFEAIARQYCQTARLSDQIVLCRVLGKYIVYADPADVGLTPHLCLDGFWEPWTTLALARVIEPGWHCLDVGANQGYFTLIMADAVGEAGRVLAVEPNPQLTELLAHSLEVNGFQGRAEIVNFAASDEDGATLDLVVPAHRGLNASICRTAAGDDRVVRVRTATLDALTQDWSRVDLIKIDVEGAEEAVWRGMRRMLERSPSVTIIMEINRARYRDPLAFVREIQAAGFALSYIAYDGSVQPLTEEQFMRERPQEDWMLFLRRES